MIVLTREELSFWDRMCVAYVESPREFRALTPEAFADAVVKARRKRYTSEEVKATLGPYRSAP